MLGPLGKQDAYYKMLNIHVNTLREWCNNVNPVGKGKTQWNC